MLMGLLVPVCLVHLGQCSSGDLCFCPYLAASLGFCLVWNLHFVSSSLGTDQVSMLTPFDKGMAMSYFWDRPDRN